MRNPAFRLLGLFKIMALALISGAAISPVSAQIIYNDFSSVAGLQLNGTALQAGNRLRLTESAGSQSGSAFSTTAISLAADVSFSSFFSFNISLPAGIGDSDGAGADGLAFVVQTVANNVGGAGGGIGYQGIDHSVGIEFDTYNNGGVDGNNGNHIGIDYNGDINSVARFNYPTRMNDGTTFFAWVDYNGATDDLEVRLSPTSARPVAPLLAQTVDLTTILGSTNAFVGFTAATGSGFGRHEILSWEFRNTFSPITEPTGVPDSGTSALLLTGAIAGLLALRRRWIRY